jgi:4,5-DOPA dioxygenase extradiol
LKGAIYCHPFDNYLIFSSIRFLASSLVGTLFNLRIGSTLSVTRSVQSTCVDYSKKMSQQSLYPCAYISHGGGPMPLLGQQTDVVEALRSIADNLPSRPAAIVIVSAHYISSGGFTVTALGKPPMYYDYGGFPPEAYELQYNAPGHPQLAQRIATHLTDAGLNCKLDKKRGFDHGVFVPLMLMFPDADIPVVMLSIDQSFDPELHIRCGRALQSLRQENVLFLGSGSSFHNFGYFFATGAKRQQGQQKAHEWNNWLVETLTSASVSCPYLFYGRFDLLLM